MWMKFLATRRFRSILLVRSISFFEYRDMSEVIRRQFYGPRKPVCPKEHDFAQAVDQTARK